MTSITRKRPLTELIFSARRRVCPGAAVVRAKGHSNNAGGHGYDKASLRPKWISRTAAFYGSLAASQAENCRSEIGQ
jgi:hypothetical protein